MAALVLCAGYSSVFAWACDQNCKDVDYEGLIGITTCYAWGDRVTNEVILVAPHCVEDLYVASGTGSAANECKPSGVSKISVSYEDCEDDCVVVDPPVFSSVEKTGPGAEGSVYAKSDVPKCKLKVGKS